MLNGQGDVLLQERNEPQRRWGLVGGLMELGESTKDVVLREVQEESGIQLSADQLRFVGVYSGKNHRSVAPNGDVFYSVITAYATDHVTAAPRVCDTESVTFRWFPLTRLPENLVGNHRVIITDYLAGQAKGS